MYPEMPVTHKNFVFSNLLFVANGNGIRIARSSDFMQQLQFDEYQYEQLRNHQNTNYYFQQNYQG
jgi:hypothetical protein